MRKKQTIVLDFDGVIHPYTRGWQGAPDKIDPEPPVPGAVRAIKILRGTYKVVVFSTRCSSERGRIAVHDYLVYHEAEVDDVSSTKPPGILYVDDRGFRFNGDWSELLRFVGNLDNMIPWNKKPRRLTETLLTDSTEQEVEDLLANMDENLDG